MNEHEKVRAAINALYKSAGITTEFTGPVNEQVAEVFGQMLNSIGQCSNAIMWVPKPPGGRVTSITWIVTNFSQSIISKLKNSQSFVCARAKILHYKSPLMIASIA